MVVGGFNTSSRAALATLINLRKNPECMEKLVSYLQTELCYDPKEKDLLPTMLSELTPKKYGELNLLSWVLKESLRLTPTAPASVDYKVVRAGCKIRGVEIPTDARIFINFGVVQRDPRQWQRPAEFLPDRYDPESPLYLRPDGGKRHPMSHIAFSFGPRNCPGQVFGLMESKIFVAYVAMKMKFDMDLDPEL